MAPLSVYLTVFGTIFILLTKRHAKVIRVPGHSYLDPALRTGGKTIWYPNSGKLN